jgi:hypothetical protein
MDPLSTDLGSPLASSAFAGGSPKRGHTPAAAGASASLLKEGGSTVLGMASGTTIRRCGQSTEGRDVAPWGGRRPQRAPPGAGLRDRGAAR